MGLRVRSARFLLVSNGSGRLIPTEDVAFLQRGRGDAAGHAEAVVPEREGENHGCSVPGVRRGHPFTSGGN